jgi:hypothetical protein
LALAPRRRSGLPSAQPTGQDPAPAPDRRHRQVSELPFADRLVVGLYGLTAEEVAVVAGAS